MERPGTKQTVEACAAIRSPTGHIIVHMADGRIMAWRGTFGVMFDGLDPSLCSTTDSGGPGTTVLVGRSGPIAADRSNTVRLASMGPDVSNTLPGGGFASTGKSLTLREKQCLFSRMTGMLHQKIWSEGYEFTYGDTHAWAEDGRHKDGSYHYKRLATDINLFLDGKYLRSTEAHRPFGEYWESLGGTWGGRFKKKDGNHYSLGE